ncbi:MAG TPA: tetratricopeptide repeat protein [Rhizomicrobium sp.]|jgi:Flp pilus assembly protein TadD
MNAYAQGLKLQATGRHAEAIACFETALAAKPGDTHTLFALGNTARDLGMARPAEEFFRRVLALEPGRLEALINLANLLRANGQFAAAQALLAPVLADVPELWLTMGSIHREQGDSAKAEAHYRRALELRPDYPAALCNLADLAAPEEALPLYDRAILRDPRNPQATLNRAILHLLHGNLVDGWRDYAARLKVPGKAPVCDHALPRWDSSPRKNKRLLVTAEQGVGDQIMFASLFGELGANVILECDPRLVSLFARSFPNAVVKPAQMESRAGIVTAHYGWLKQSGGANLAIEMGSLPKLLRKRLGQFPRPHAYLVPEPAPKRGGAIGICWRSGKLGGERSRQFAPLEAWAAFIRDIPGEIVSIQYDATREEVAALESHSGRAITMIEGLDQKNELDRACTLFSTLDAVVSAPTAVSWLAPAVGVPTCKILYDTSWTAFGQDYEPLAPACSLMMPGSPGDWRSVFAKTAARIKTEAK